MDRCIEMPVCVHSVPVKFYCGKCTEENKNFSIFNLSQRIENIEKQLNGIQSLLNDVNSRTIGYPATRELMAEHLGTLQKKVDASSKNIVNLNEEFYFIKAKLNKVKENNSKPHKCPVCYGKIKILIDPSAAMSGIEAMFCKRDINGMYYKDCIACESKGVLWR